MSLTQEFVYWEEKPGSVVGNTPFGFYDIDPQFQSEAPKFSVWAGRRLGFPVIDIELKDVNFYACFEEAISEYAALVNQQNIIDNLFNLQGYPTGSTSFSHRLITPNLSRVITVAEQYAAEAGTGGDVTWKKHYLNVTGSIQDYNLKDWISSIEPSTSIEIKRVHHYELPAITRFFDPYAGTGVGMQYTMQEFGWETLSPAVSFIVMPIFEDLLRLQQIEFNQLVRRSAYTFELIGDKLRLFPIPSRDMRLWIDYADKLDTSNPFVGNPWDNTGVITDLSDVPYLPIIYREINYPGRNWIFQYALACVKEMLGGIRNKYDSIPIPDDEIQLDGATLRSEGIAAKEKLVDDLKGTLELTSRKTQMERKKEEAENQQTILSLAPLKIYVG